jgi:hypothetical protein
MDLQTHAAKKYPDSALLKSSAGLGWSTIADASHRSATHGDDTSGIPSFLNGQDFGVFPRFGPTRSAQIG